MPCSAVHRTQDEIFNQLIHQTMQTLELSKMDLAPLEDYEMQMTNGGLEWPKWLKGVTWAAVGKELIDNWDEIKKGLADGWNSLN